MPLSRKSRSFLHEKVRKAGDDCMYTLLLRLSGLFQAWGSDSKYEIRRTDPFPTKSGVTGILAAAIGLSREDKVGLRELACLRFGLRVDQPGAVFTDFQTAKAIDDKDDISENRYYLRDAKFLAGFESEDLNILEKLDYALNHPVYALFLGRRACPATLPLSLGIRETKLEKALEDEPSLSRVHTDEKLRIVVESQDNARYYAHDLPVSYSREQRIYEYRPVREYFVYAPDAEKDTQKNVVLPEHDPMSFL